MPHLGTQSALPRRTGRRDDRGGAASVHPLREERADPISHAEAGLEGFGRGAQLGELAGLEPLVGLLGTVLGMFRAFGGIASDVAAGAKPVVLAQGVSQAIVTTIFGLAVAIPALLAHAFFRRRAQRRIAEIEELA